MQIVVSLIHGRGRGLTLSLIPVTFRGMGPRLFPRPAIVASALALAILAFGCDGPDEFEDECRNPYPINAEFIILAGNDACVLKPSADTTNWDPNLGIITALGTLEGKKESECGITIFLASDGPRPCWVYSDFAQYTQSDKTSGTAAELNLKTYEQVELGSLRYPEISGNSITLEIVEIAVQRVHLIEEVDPEVIVLRGGIKAYER